MSEKVVPSIERMNQQSHPLPEPLRTFKEKKVPDLQYRAPNTYHLPDPRAHKEVLQTVFNTMVLRQSTTETALAMSLHPSTREPTIK